MGKREYGALGMGEIDSNHRDGRIVDEREEKERLDGICMCDADMGEVFHYTNPRIAFRI